MIENVNIIAVYSRSLSSVVLVHVLAGTCLFVALCVHSFCIQGSNRIACSTFYGHPPFQTYVSTLRQISIRTIVCLSSTCIV